MFAAVVATFIIGYAAIVFEHPLRLDKTVPALIMGALCWAFVSLGHIHVHGELNAVMEVGKAVAGVPGQSDLLLESAPYVAELHSLDDVLLHHIGKIAEILLFLLGAMTIVELIDIHKGFSVITNRIKTTSTVKLLWVIGFLAFFLSATLDNLAATIVLVSLLRRLVPERNQRLVFVSFAVIAANAGGAWSPIGDVTTTMLWIGERVTTGALITKLFIPSLVCMIVPLIIMSFTQRGKQIQAPEIDREKAKDQELVLGSRRMLGIGVAALVFVPIFKSITHLPPYVGMMLGLGIVWLVSEMIHSKRPAEIRHQFSAHRALQKIEMPSILFFLGILLAVTALESIGALKSVAVWLDNAIPNTEMAVGIFGRDVVVMILGVASALIDNVPLVAATMGMYSEATDSNLWHFIAYCAGTGGSMLIIGSAAGVAAMGMERIDFIWYLKKFAPLAFAGYLAGAFVYLFFFKV